MLGIILVFPDRVPVCHSVGNLTGNNLKLDVVKESSHTEKCQTYKDVHCKLREFCKRSIYFEKVWDQKQMQCVSKDETMKTRG